MDPIHDSVLFQNYLTRSGQFDEVFARNQSIKPVYSDVIGAFSALSPDEYRQLNEFAKKSFLSQGITFATYSRIRVALNEYSPLISCRVSSISMNGM